MGKGRKFKTEVAFVREELADGKQRTRKRGVKGGEAEKGVKR